MRMNATLPPAPNARRHLIRFGAAALLLALLGVAEIYLAERYVEAAGRASVRSEALTALARLDRAERAAIAQQRAYLLTGDRELQARFQQSIADVSQASRTLRLALEHAGSEDRALDQLNSALDVRLRRAAMVVETHDREGLAAAQALVRDGTGQALEQQVAAAIERVGRDAEASFAAAHAESGQRARWLLVAASLGAPVALAVLALGFLTLRREVESRRIAEEQNAAARLNLEASVAQLTRLSRDMQRLSAYAGLLQTCNSLEELLDVTRVCFAALFPEQAGVVYLHRSDLGSAVAAAHWGDTCLQSADRIQTAECWGLRRTRTYASGGEHGDLRCGHLAGSVAGVQTCCVPLMAHGQPLGLLYLDGVHPVPDERLTATAAEQLSLALANLRLREELRDQSIRDTLTGIYNRRYLEHSLDSERARCERNGRPLSLLMIDVDHFKRFNDQHGHAAGDAMLAAVGSVLRATVREGDIPCRYGGEEFTLILPDTGEDGALALAEAVRLAIRSMQVQFEGRLLPAVTASCGVSTLPGTAGDIDQLLDSADRALYEAKTAGRDRVQLARPS